MSEFNLPIIHQIQEALVEVKPLMDVANARIAAESVKKVNEITTRSATTSSRKTEKFRVNPFAKVLLCTTSLLPAIVVLPPAIFAQGVDPNTVCARAFAVLAAEPYVKQGFHVREDY